MYATDTIAAIATPVGQGGVGIVRVSGPHAEQIATATFRGPTALPAAWQSHRLYAGTVTDTSGTALDHGLAVLMRGPHSFTGEDVLELHCHGSPIGLRRVLATVLARGARLAEPGEFTRRAFLNGRIDLAQAEAVIDLVRARTDAGVVLATQQLGGHLSARLETIRADLIRLLALLEVQIDFVDEDVAIEAEEPLALADGSLAAMRELAASFRRGKAVRDGVRVAIVGKPNVGKSSLLNALLGENRAIVTPVAGTTRDTIEDGIDLDGIPVVLTDTAGLHEADRLDAVEALGMDRTRAAMRTADLLLVVLDASAPLDTRDLAVTAATANARRVLVLNKIDLAVHVGVRDLAECKEQAPVVWVSAATGLGLNELRGVMRRCVLEEQATDRDVPVLTRVRHRDALDKAMEALSLARRALADGQVPELVAVDVRDAVDHIGAVTGAVTTEDVLDEIFSAFCLGK